MAELLLAEGVTAFVDDDMLPIVSQYVWYIFRVKASRTLYVATHRLANQDDNTVKIKRTILLHHLVIGFPISPFVVDHLNGNGLDNRRENLRVTSKSQNQRNRYTHRAGRLLGCTFERDRIRTKPWRAQIYLGKGKYKNLGRFETELQAHQKYLEAQALSPCR